MIETLRYHGNIAKQGNIPPTHSICQSLLLVPLSHSWTGCNLQGLCTSLSQDTTRLNTDFVLITPKEGETMPPVPESLAITGSISLSSRLHAVLGIPHLPFPFRFHYFPFTSFPLSSLSLTSPPSHCRARQTEALQFEHIHFHLVSKPLSVTLSTHASSTEQFLFLIFLHSFIVALFHGFLSCFVAPLRLTIVSRLTRKYLFRSPRERERIEQLYIFAPPITVFTYH